MSERAGSAPSRYQAGSTVASARQVAAGRLSLRAPRTGLANARPSRPDDGLPPWPRVIATTVRLWLQRHVLRPDAPAGRRRRSRRWAGAFGLAIVVFAAGALTIALAQGQTARTVAHSKHTHTVRLSTGALKVAAQNRQQAAAWVVAEVDRSAIVSCDPVMCAALQSLGFPAGDLVPLGPSATDPMGSQVVVSTTALRNQFGSHLPDVYAPVVIASFGAGATRVDIRVEAPDGSQAYLVAQRADLLARQESGQQLLRNKFLHMPEASRQALAAGRVDSRLLLTLAALTAQGHQVYLYRFGDPGPGAAPDVPLRIMRIAALVTKGHRTSGAYLDSVLTFLRAQQPPFRASYAVLHLPGAKTVIQIQFAAPSPLGLLGAHAAP